MHCKECVNKFGESASLSKQMSLNDIYFLSSIICYKTALSRFSGLRKNLQNQLLKVCEYNYIDLKFNVINFICPQLYYYITFCTIIVFKIFIFVVII